MKAAGGIPLPSRRGLAARHVTSGGKDQDADLRSRYHVSKHARKVDIRLHGRGNSKFPWRKAGQPSHLVDVVD